MVMLVVKHIFGKAWGEPMLLNKFDRFLLLFVLLALCVNVAAGYVGKFSYAEKCISNIVLAIISLWAVIFVSKIIHYQWQIGSRGVDLK